jgi:CoA:oxalate CoA-transferase
VPAEPILDDVTVLDASQGMAGAYCTKLLAALGARVIKAEPPTGDPTRRTGPFYKDQPDLESSALFLYLNTSKQSITLNPDTVDGRQLLTRLASNADILVESFAPGTMEAWGLGYSSLLPRSSSLIHCAITPFGQTGPYKDFKATEIVLEALGALLYPMGVPDREPLKLGDNPSLMAGGISAFSAIMVALHRRDLTGEGEYIDLSLMESTLMTQIHSTIYSQMGDYDHPRRPDQLSRTKDGWINVGIQDASWKEFCDLIRRPDLVNDPRFVDMAARREHAEAMNEVVKDWLAEQNKMEAYHTLQGMRSIAGYVATTAELFESEQLKARNFFRPVDHPVTGPIPYPGPAFQIDEVPWRQDRAPLLGEHNVAVYHHELGIPKEELVRLREQGTI